MLTRTTGSYRACIITFSFPPKKYNGKSECVNELAHITTVNKYQNRNWYFAFKKMFLIYDAVSKC